MYVYCTKLSFLLVKTFKGVFSSVQLPIKSHSKLYFNYSGADKRSPLRPADNLLQTHVHVQLVDLFWPSSRVDAQQSLSVTLQNLSNNLYCYIFWDNLFQPITFH